MSSQPRMIMLEDHSIWLEQARVSLPDAIRLGAKDQLRIIDGKHFRRIEKHVEFTAPSDISPQWKQIRKQWWHYADDPGKTPIKGISSTPVFSQFGQFR